MIRSSLVKSIVSVSYTHLVAIGIEGEERFEEKEEEGKVITIDPSVVRCV